MKITKSFKMASLIVCVVGFSILSIFLYLFVVNRPVATVFYHFDYQYRAGRPEIEENTITESIYNILDIFDRHPSWHLSIEIQSEIIPIMYENYSDVFDMIKRMVDREQLELCAIEYSEMLAHAFPYSDFNHSAWYSDQILEEYDLKKSRSVLLQEGQWLPAFFQMKQYGYQNFMADAAKFLYYGFEPTAPVYSWDLTSYDGLNPDPNYPAPNEDPIYIVNYKHVPTMEAGVNHFWLWTQDAEIQLEDQKADEEKGTEFEVSEDLKEQYEARLEQLEAIGTQFMTVAEWVDFCIENGAIEELDFYMPETHWYPADYRGTWRWMGDNQGHTDDGSMLALHYRTRNKIQAVEAVFKNSSVYLTMDELNSCSEYIERAWKFNMLAESTDVLGLAPRDHEREYGFSNSQSVINELNKALSILKSKNPHFAIREKIQVDIETGKVLLGNVSGYEFIAVKELSSGYSKSDLPIKVSISTEGLSNDYNSSVRRCEYQGVIYWELNLGFAGSMDWEESEAEISIELEWDSGTIQYSPSLLEDTTVTLNRDDYDASNDIFLPLSNGLIYGGEQALVKNCSAHHTAALWKSDSLGFEESQLHFWANYQLFILDKGIDTNTCLEFANRVNTSPIVEITEVLLWP